MSDRLAKRIGEMKELPEPISWAAIAGTAADPMPPEIAAPGDGGAPVWIFAYGSLMWNPEIACTEARSALLPDYAGALSLDDKARLILAATGHRRNCREYFVTALGHLEQLGLIDRPLRRLAERVAALEGER